MRNARGHPRYGFLTGETDEGLRVGLAGPAQPQPPGLEPEDIVAGEVGKHRLAPIRTQSLPLGHGCENDEREGGAPPSLVISLGAWPYRGLR